MKEYIIQFEESQKKVNVDFHDLAYTMFEYCDEIAKDIGIETIERKIDLHEVYECDEAFFTGTAAEVTPIIEIDNTKINAGIPGKITKALQNNYFNLIRGKYEKHNEWLTNLSKA